MSKIKMFVLLLSGVVFMTIQSCEKETKSEEITVLSSSCDAISNFLPNEKYEELEVILSSADISSWIIKKFTINGASVEEKYSGDRVEFDFSKEQKLGYIRDFDALGLRQAFPSFLSENTEDDENVLVRGEDGSLEFTFSFIDLYDISSDSPEVYKDFTSSTYKIVKDASADKIELRSCTDNVVLTLEKAATLDFCELEGDFVSFDELAATKFLISNAYDSDSNSFLEPWLVKTFTIGDDEVTNNYEDISFAFDRGGSTVYLSEPVGAAGSITYTKGENNELRVALRVNFEGLNDFDARFYRVVKGATDSSFELRSCTWDDQKPVIIVFEKL